MVEGGIKMNLYSSLFLHGKHGTHHTSSLLRGPSRLAVFQHWNPNTRQYGDPVVHVLGLPAPAKVGSICILELPGLILSDLWDPELMESTMPPLPVTECSPIMITSSGYSHTLKTPTLANLLDATAPLVLLDGQHLAESVTNGNIKYLCVFLLPVTCQIPFGMTRALSQLTFRDMVPSIHRSLSQYYLLQNPHRCSSENRRTVEDLADPSTGIPSLIHDLHAELH